MRLTQIVVAVTILSTLIGCTTSRRLGDAPREPGIWSYNTPAWDSGPQCKVLIAVDEGGRIQPLGFASEASVFATVFGGVTSVIGPVWAAHEFGHHLEKAQFGDVTRLNVEANGTGVGIGHGGDANATNGNMPMGGGGGD